MVTEPMLRHIVLLAFNVEAASQDIVAVEQSFRQLPSAIAAIANLEWGRAVGDSHEYQYSMIVSFHTEADLEDYNNHPAHQAIAARYGRLGRQIIVGDYWMAAGLGNGANGM
jgi:stress responsive alpha/beta barrel protein